MSKFQQADFHRFFINNSGGYNPPNFTELLSHVLPLTPETLNMKILDTRFKGVTLAWFLFLSPEGKKLLLDNSDVLQQCHLDVNPEGGEGVTLLWLIAGTPQGATFLSNNLNLLTKDNLDAGPTEGPNEGTTVLLCLAATPEGRTLLAKNPDLLFQGNLDAGPTEGPDKGKTVLWQLVTTHEGRNLLANKPELLTHANLDAGPSSTAYAYSILIYLLTHGEFLPILNKNPNLLFNNCRLDSRVREHSLRSWIISDFLRQDNFPQFASSFYQAFFIKLVREYYPTLTLLENLINAHPGEIIPLLATYYRNYQGPNRVEIFKYLLGSHFFVEAVKYNPVYLQEIASTPGCSKLIDTLSNNLELTELLRVLVLILGKRPISHLNSLANSLESAVEKIWIMSLPDELKLPILKECFFKENPGYEYLQPIFPSICERAIANYKESKAAHLSQFVLASLGVYFKDDKRFNEFIGSNCNKFFLKLITECLINYYFGHEANFAERKEKLELIPYLIEKSGKQSLTALSPDEIHSLIPNFFDNPCEQMSSLKSSPTSPLLAGSFLGKRKRPSESSGEPPVKNTTSNKVAEVDDLYARNPGCSSPS